jgi:hypothetical protein
VVAALDGEERASLIQALLEIEAKLEGASA